VRLLFKFRESAAPPDRERVLSSMREHGARAVEPLFPDARDDELASVFVLDPGSESESDAMLALLRGEEAVEYAEPEVTRKLAS
jgi:hypothetical protein